MTLSYCEQAANGSRFNLWVTVEDHSKVICYGTWEELVEFVQPIIGDRSVRAVHVLPDQEEPTFIPSDAFSDEDEDSDHE